MIKNKKGGIGFPEFFIVITIVALIFVLLAVNKQITGSAWTIGERQLPLIEADNQKNFILDTIDKNAAFALDKSLQILDERAGFEKEACGGWNLGCAIINSKTKPKELCLPDISSCLNKFFSQELYDLNKNSGIHSLLFPISYELYVNDSVIRGIPLKEITMSLGMFNFDAEGDFSFRPAFTIIKNNELGYYPEFVFPILKKIAKNCPYQKDIKACNADWIPETNDKLEWQTWMDNTDKDLYYFKINFKEFKRYACYGLYLPKSKDSSLKI